MVYQCLNCDFKAEGMYMRCDYCDSLNIIAIDTPETTIEDSSSSLEDGHFEGDFEFNKPQTDIED